MRGGEDRKGTRNPAVPRGILAYPTYPAKKKLPRVHVQREKSCHKEMLPFANEKGLPCQSTVGIQPSGIYSEQDGTTLCRLFEGKTQLAPSFGGVGT